jgi:hypothetical protein
MIGSTKKVEFVQRILPESNKIGQIGGIDTDKNGDLVIFHRGSRKWQYE